MKAIRSILHGFVLLAANLFGILLGFVTYHALDAREQLGIQLPVGVLLSVVLYLAWVHLLRRLSLSRLILQNRREHVLAGLASLLWSPIIFIPLHYFTQGYLTGTGNIIAVAMFQIPVNAIAVWVAWKTTQPNKEPTHTHSGTRAMPAAGSSPLSEVYP